MIFRYVLIYMYLFYVAYLTIRKEDLRGYRFINDVITHLITNLNVEGVMRARARYSARVTLVLWWYFGGR